MKVRKDEVVNRQALKQVEARVAETIEAKLKAESRSAGAYWTVVREWHRMLASYYSRRLRALIETRDKLESEARDRLISYPDGHP